MTDGHALKIAMDVNSGTLSFASFLLSVAYLTEKDAKFRQQNVLNGVFMMLFSVMTFWFGVAMHSARFGALSAEVFGVFVALSLPATMIAAIDFASGRQMGDFLWGTMMGFVVVSVLAVSSSTILTAMLAAKAMQ